MRRTGGEKMSHKGGLMPRVWRTHFVTKSVSSLHQIFNQRLGTGCCLIRVIKKVSIFEDSRLQMTVDIIIP